MKKYSRSKIKKETIVLLSKIRKNRNSPRRYHDHTVLHWGRYSSKMLCEIPPDYLLKFHKHPEQCNDRSLLIYIKINRKRIIGRKEGKVIIFYDLCKKKTFETQELAHQKLVDIAKEKYPIKKPIREYNCPWCGGWHLTSAPE